MIYNDVRFLLALLGEREGEVSESHEEQRWHLLLSRLEDLKSAKGKAVSNWKVDRVFSGKPVIDESKKVNGVFKACL